MRLAIGVFLASSERGAGGTAADFGGDRVDVVFGGDDEAVGSFVDDGAGEVVLLDDVDALSAVGAARFLGEDARCGGGGKGRAEEAAIFVF